MLTVACVLKSGGIYDTKWVERLRAGVERHLSVPHIFVCLTDISFPCPRVPLVHDWLGWWAKIELFRLSGPLLYIDLDTAIVGSLDDMAEAAERHDLVMLRDFYAQDHHGSGVMAWRGEAPAKLYDGFRPEMMRQSRARMGDQAYIEEAYGGEITKWQDILPGQCVSYKVHCRDGIPAGARLVCLHGRPKFADMLESDPVRLAWET